MSLDRIVSRSLDRRTFLRAASLAAPTMLMAERIAADPYGPAELSPTRMAPPVRVRGLVRGNGRGIPRVAVSDGLDVVATDASGRFELVTSADRDFVHVTVPAGWRVPTNPTGTARFYSPIARDQTEMDVVFELDPLDRTDERHTLILLGDIQTEDALEMQWFHEQSVPDIRGTVAALGDQEVFGIACGDIMFDNLGLYPEYERGVHDMGVPFFQVVGNHDLDQGGATDVLSTRTFQSHFGPRHYSFERGAVHYVVLDDVFWHGSGYIGYLDADVLGWLERDLALVEPGRPVIVATHIPVLGSRHVREGRRSPGLGVAVTNRQALYRLLEPYRAHVLAGHTHESEHGFEGGVHEHVAGAICGAWWSGPICGDGTPNGYALYEVQDEDVRWRYKVTGEPDSHQMRLYAPGSDASAPGELVANVWDWDPEWTVTWFEDGDPKGLMTQRQGRDPLSTELHTGDQLPPRRPWVDPYPVAHLFYAPMSVAAREVRVEARDRSGRVYSETLRVVR